MSVFHPLMSRFLRVFFTFRISSASSVSSSLRAIANSFNLKRATSNKPDDGHTTRSNIIDELATHSVPYSSIPEAPQSDMPQTDHFKFSTPDSTMDEHLPGHPGYSSISALTTAPTGSTTGQPKTTIRLVSALNTVSALSPEHGTPQLRPVDPPFDLVMGSPGKCGVPVWPLSPQPEPSERLYPVLPVDELEVAKQSQAKSRLPDTGSAGSSQPLVSSAKAYPKPSNNVQDLFSPAPKLPSKQENVGIPRSEPFLFGSPLPRHSVSNKAFDTAAASVLEEMNKRLSAAGVQKVGTDVFGTIPAATATTNADSGSLRASGMLDRFDKLHEEQFNKMDSIMNHYAARRGAPGSKKRKSDVLGNGSAPVRNRPSTAPRKKMGIPGGFDDEEMADDIQEEEDRRMSKRVRVLEDEGGKDKGRRLTLLSNKTEAEEKQADRERVATRKMLEAKKKRRSSRHGRTSLAGPQAVSSTFSLFSRPMIEGPLTRHRVDKGKATPRFGVFSAAKSIVRTVWNFGVGSPTKASRTSTSQPAATGATELKQTKPAPPNKTSLSGRKSIAPARTASTLGKAPKSSGDVAAKGGASSSQVRLSSLSSKTGAKLLNPGSTSSRQSVRTSSASATTKPAVPPPSGERTGTAAGAASNNKTSIFSPSRAASRLFAPTASSLAKMRGGAGPGPASVKKSKTSAIIAQRARTPPRNAVLDAITNSPHGAGGGVSPSPGKIFTTPLLMPSSKQAVIPPPVKPTSLAAAATALAATTTANDNTARKGTRNASSFASSASTAARRAPASPSSTTTKPTTSSATRKPRISRSRIIAKVGAQRLAAITTNRTGPTANPSASLSRSAGGSRIPRASGSTVRSPRVRSSMGTATRRSYAGSKSATRGSDVLMSAKKHARQSEYVRRRSRFAGSAIGAGVMAGGSNADDDGANGSMAMEVDDD